MSDDLEWMIERQIPHLRRYALALTRDRDTADEVVQDTLERALRKKHLWHRRGTIRSWLFRILYRQSVDHFRRQRRDEVPADTDMIDGVASLPSSQEQRIDCLKMAEALDRLPQEQRAVVLLAALEGLPYDEIAEIMGVPVGTVRSRLSRAREALRLFREQEPAGSRHSSKQHPAQRANTARLRTVK